MRLIVLLYCAALIAAGAAWGMQFERTVTSYAVSDSDSHYRYRLTFWKDQDSSVFRGLQFRYQRLDPKQTKEKPDLANCMPIISRLWGAAAESITIGLRYADVGYPTEYRDLLRRQIEVFTASADWRRQLKQRKPSNDFRTLGPIMKQGRVYGCLDSLFASHGYVVKTIGTEKHGYLRREDVKDLGPLPDLRGLKLRDIPLPFIVTITVAQRDSTAGSR